MRTHVPRFVPLVCLCLSTGIWPAFGCRREGAAPSPAAPSPASASSPATTTYKLTGVVRKVEAGSGVVTIRHDAIPGFMEAMTMPFTLKDRSVLDDVHPGDEVEGTLRVDREHGEIKDYDLTGLVVTRPAPPPSLSLNLSGGSVELRPSPRILDVGDEVPDFTFTTQNGERKTLAGLRGEVVVLTFIYTRCPLPDFCPAMDRKFAELADKLRAVPGRAEHVRLLSLSFDPEHDTPSVLREHAKVQGAKPPLWTFAVASHDELGKVAPALGLSYGPTGKEIVHNLSTAVIDPRGRLARLETGTAGKTWKPTDLLKTIVPLIPGSKP